MAGTARHAVCYIEGCEFRSAVAMRRSSWPKRRARKEEVPHHRPTGNESTLHSDGGHDEQGGTGVAREGPQAAERSFGDFRRGQVDVAESAFTTGSGTEGERRGQVDFAESAFNDGGWWNRLVADFDFRGFERSRYAHTNRFEVLDDDDVADTEPDVTQGRGGDGSGERRPSDSTPGPAHLQHTPSRRWCRAGSVRDRVRQLESRSGFPEDDKTGSNKAGARKAGEAGRDPGGRDSGYVTPDRKTNAYTFGSPIESGNEEDIDQYENSWFGQVESFPQSTQEQGSYAGGPTEAPIDPLQVAIASGFSGASEQMAFIRWWNEQDQELHKKYVKALQKATEDSVDAAGA